MQLEAMYPGEDGKTFIAMLLTWLNIERTLKCHNFCAQLRMLLPMLCMPIDPRTRGNALPPSHLTIVN